MKRMLGCLDQLKKNEKGAVILLVAAGMTVFFGLTALVIDGGNLYLERARLQKAMDAAVLAGAQELPNRSDLAKQEAQRAAAANGVPASELAIEFDNANTIIRASSVRTKQLIFGRAVGIPDPPVGAAAKVQLRPLTSATGVIPLGVDSSRSLSFGDPVVMKAGEATVGNFGALVLTGPGASNYQKDLQNGFQNELSIGNILDTQTGNLVGPTKKAMQDRIDRCPYHGSATYYDYPKDCPLVVLIPVYKPVVIDQNQVKRIEVVGFASFFLEKVGSSKDSAEVIGRFIQTAYSGANSTSQANYGAYGYKLVD
ncbi:TadE/TadG family type IV pilus assembly protein [Effusibacillus consociatus]|uniref:TadE/TadG family type IV pilus assembly protein n=1 Tax=Effusibacillus consociatus TaxID=1117041 RepID=A0ABV9Q5H9_9BACL